jgi:RNA polymerase sigma-32 factor
MRAPKLERDDEAALAQRWRACGDRAALDALIAAHTRLVVACAKRFRRYGLPFGDLIQEGNLGLMLAAARFEPARDVRFATYAEWWVRARMQDFVLRNWSIVRTGTTRRQKALFFNFGRLRARIEAKGSVLGRPDRSLNDPIQEGRREQIQDALADASPGPEDITLAQHDSRIAAAWLAAAMAELSPASA